MARAPKEPISEVTEWDGKRVKIARATLEKLRADVDGPKRFYTEQWLADYLARFEVVKACEACQEPLVAEEVDSHGFKHVAPSVRPILRMYMDLNDDDRAAVREFVAASH
jgi:hypothetical protein